MASFTEIKFKSNTLSNLQKFLMELGRGHAFVAKQKYIRTEKEDYYIDLVFTIISSNVLVDLKTSIITHQDVGQMDGHVRMCDKKAQ